MLALETVEAFAKADGFRLLAEDQVAANPAVYFGIERFAPAEGFTPSKPFLTRLRWRDLEGNDQSKLLLTNPETVIAALTPDLVQPAADTAPPKRVSRRKGRAHARAPATQP